MDGAIRLLQSAEPCFVSAEDIADQFHGLVPDTIRFVCPYCSRPVDAFAMRNITARRSAHPDMRNMRPHFRHHKNDERARRCPFYDGVDAITDFRAERIALLPMFLRKSGSGFILEIGIRYDPYRLAKTSDEHIEIEGRPYPISDFSRRRSFKVRLENPSLSFTTLVKLPDDDVTSIGNIDDSKLLIFDDAFGTEGGHRLAPGSSLHPERAYFVVTPATYPLNPPRGIDARRVGNIPSSHGTLIVYRIAFAARKREWVTVSDWLDSLGFELAAYERKAQCLWPPILQSSGVDEPCSGIRRPCIYLRTRSRRFPVTTVSTYCALGRISMPRHIRERTESWLAGVKRYSGATQKTTASRTCAEDASGHRFH